MATGKWIGGLLGFLQGGGGVRSSRFANIRASTISPTQYKTKEKMDSFI